MNSEERSNEGGVEAAARLASLKPGSKVTKAVVDDMLAMAVGLADRMAAAERERDCAKNELREVTRRGHALDKIARDASQIAIASEVERDAALARIAAVEALCAKRDAYLAAEAAHDRFSSLPVVWINEVRAVLAASPTPTGPDKETPHHYSRGYPISDAEHAWDVAGDVPCPDCGGSGNGSTLDGRDLGVCPRCGGDGLAATPEPTEETDNLDRRRGGYITSGREMVIPAVPAGPGPGGADPKETGE